MSKTTTTKKPATKKSAAKPAKKTKAPVKVEGMSALDAAAKVLGESNEPLNAKEIIKQAAAKGYWQSPGGKTPHQTLVASILREITTKGSAARFRKTSPGHYGLRTSKAKRGEA
jgi:hypothetical protein